MPKNKFKRDRKIAATNRRGAKRREAAKARRAGQTTTKKSARHPRPQAPAMPYWMLGLMSRMGLR